MRIFIAFLQSKEKHPIPAYDFWEYYIKQGITEAGHEWVECEDVDWAFGLTSQEATVHKAWLDKTWQRTIDFLKKERVDLFLSYLYPEQVSMQAVEAIKSMGIPCVNFFCDHIRLFTHVPVIYSCFSLNWVPEYAALEMYKRADLPYIHAPMPVWVPAAYRNIPEHESYRPTFIGSIDIQRALLFQDVLAAYKDIDIRGAGWLDEGNANILPAGSQRRTNMLKNQVGFIRKNGVTGLYHKLQQKFNPPVINKELLAAAVQPKPQGDEYFNISREAAITIGVNRCPGFRAGLKNPVKYSRLRDLEAPMLGACYLTENAPGIEALYETGKEIEIYNTPDELVEKINILLRDPARRRMLREQGQQKALHQHSIPATLKKISEKL